jgi:hypothetical protein
MSRIVMVTADQNSSVTCPGAVMETIISYFHPWMPTSRQENAPGLKRERVRKLSP